MVVASPPAVAFERPTGADDLRSARRDRVRFVDVPGRAFLAIDGSEPPGGEEFQRAVETLYPVAYTLHFALKERSVSAPVGALEGLFWLTPEELLADPAQVEADRASRGWHWRLLLPVPDEASEVEIEAAMAAAARKRPLRAADRLRVLRWTEGTAAQILHVGPYEAEQPTIRTLHDAIAAAGLRPRGHHHEVYLSDPRRGNPDRIKTLLRQPVEPA
jgi:hypothetical protein